jgi:hypothetical protein
MWCRRREGFATNKTSPPSYDAVQGKGFLSWRCEVVAKQLLVVRRNSGAQIYALMSEKNGNGATDAVRDGDRDEMSY